jgi:hypothetical protein
MGTDIHIVCQINEIVSSKWETIDTGISRDRNYDTFAVLAGVRNGSGFAGCDTGEGWKVLFPPRGIPKDYVRKSGLPYEEGDDTDELYELGDHSYSWLTLAELHQIWDYYKDREYEVHGMISPEQHKDLQEGKLPQFWCGWTSDKSYIKTTWKVKAAEHLWLLKALIKDLEKVQKENSNTAPETIRIVFGFDS